MTSSVREPRTVALDGLPWFWATLFLQLVLFAIPAVIAWNDSLNAAAYLPLIALPISLVMGLLMLTSRSSRWAGGRVVAGTLVAAVLELGLTCVLVLAYASSTPGWDLS